MKSSFQIDSEVENALSLINKFRREVASRILGQREMIDAILMGILTEGHVLLEGVPGLAKTLTIQTVSDVLDLGFKRVQFTPDLLPSDLTGNMVYKSTTGTFKVRKGPVFSNIILADEINRAPAKVQSALLEAMSERQVTLGDETHKLPDPFFVLATQNPIEQEGTYNLPEAQLDRFLLKVNVKYPSIQDEIKLLKIFSVDGGLENIKVAKVMNAYSLADLKRIVGKVKVDDKIMLYIVTLIAASRENDKKTYPFAKYIEFGASPRASLSLLKCARVNALYEGRLFVLPEDVKAVAYNVLRHRITPSYEAEVEEMNTDDIIKILLSAVALP
ncbi:MULTISPECIES: AAA family ATPase [Borrelia]|uniref:MoxR-like ATPase n=4 Tax=Borrelia TaxID=138 RepID=A0AAN0X5S3_BORHE|nr:MULTISPECIES: MoxR family ATPase [Borrelia]AAX16693.1 MoxR protein [Borrelia hermsii DAH]AHH03135.1 MoxR-like ATPase [Borrelia nietonii YOR]AHH12190.1 MoxR-like ATPase [Borrelia hermsii YBT]AHH13673.1 MoxR-like ATPase [Borrelia hermsii MTW]AJW72995.1 ATPase [Borrelia hermsii CC1]